MGLVIAYISQLVLILITSRPSSATVLVSGQNAAAAAAGPDVCISLCRNQAAVDPRACFTVCRGLRGGDTDTEEAQELRSSINLEAAPLAVKERLRLPAPPFHAQILPLTYTQLHGGDVPRRGDEAESLVKRGRARPRPRRPRGRANPCARVCQRQVYLSHGSCLRCVFKYTNLMKI